MKTETQNNFPLTACVRINTSIGREASYYMGVNDASEALSWLASFNPASIINFSMFASKSQING